MTAVQRMGGNDCLATAGRDPRLARDGKLSEYPRNLLQLCPGIPCAMFHVAVDGPLHTEAEEGAYISLSFWKTDWTCLSEQQRALSWRVDRVTRVSASKP
jgi:hypothetical protein